MGAKAAAAGEVVVGEAGGEDWLDEVDQGGLQHAVANRHAGDQAWFGISDGDDVETGRLIAAGFERGKQFRELFILSKEKECHLGAATLASDRAHGGGFEVCWLNELAEEIRNASHEEGERAPDARHHGLRERSACAGVRIAPPTAASLLGARSTGRGFGGMRQQDAEALVLDLDFGVPVPAVGRAAMVRVVPVAAAAHDAPDASGAARSAGSSRGSRKWAVLIVRPW